MPLATRTGLPSSVLVSPVRLSRGIRSWLYIRAAPEVSIVLCLCWLLSLACLNPPGRGANLDFGSLDTTAIIKVLSRFIALIVLLLLVLRMQAHMRGMRVLSYLFPQILFASWAVASTIWSPLKAASLGHG